MKIAVIGGGIVGLSAVRILTTALGQKDVTLISETLGGEFRIGGLKYIKYTQSVDRFLNTLGIDYSLSKVNGAVMVGGGVLLFPDYLLHFPSKLDKIQRMYHTKTRGGFSKFNSTCMNDPLNIRNDLSVGFDRRLFFDILQLSVQDEARLEFSTVTQEYFKHLINKYDLIIYTIPLEILIKATNSHINIHFNKLRITKIRVKNLDKVWWDYLYIPSQVYPFHRISKETVNGEHYLYFEVNDQFTSLGERTLLDSMLDYLELIDCEHYFDEGEDDAKTVFVKGQLRGQNKFEDTFGKIGSVDVPLNKIFLLGRFAQNDSRMTYDKALDRMYKEFPKLLKKD